MKQNRKRFYLIEAALASFILILGIQIFFEKKADDHSKITVILPDSENHSWSAFRYGLKMAAQDTGTELLIVSTGKTLTAEEELKLISQELEQDTQAVIIQPVPGTDLAENLKKLEKKIPIMLVKDTLPQDPASTPFPVTEPDHEAMGKALEEQIM